ncbi:unnamed protein product [Heligmosomoides polygyrus]|uniref:Reverse transcriptase domain-containing protein n=1 Tax=Heligmosomoides polygyrus TaxID=6339 RepID=A0A183GP07_HELPZ|nr:unnamed protein product [Heligmosomoides polygyrus]
MQTKFAPIFAPGLGCCTKSKASLKLKNDVKPVFRKARPVPYAAIPRISQEIDRLVTINVLSPVDHSEWAAPVVVVQKKNGSIRLCADYPTGLNDALDQHQHPLPTPDDIFTRLNGGRYFSQIFFIFFQAFFNNKWTSLLPECKELPPISTILLSPAGPLRNIMHALKRYFE